MSSIKSARVRGNTHPANRRLLGESGAEACRDSVAVIMEFMPMSFTQYELMADQLKLQRDGLPLSALFHWYRVYPGGIRVIEIWPSRSAFIFFLERILQPLVNDLRLPEPHLSCHDIPRVAHHE